MTDLPLSTTRAMKILLYMAALVGTALCCETSVAAQERGSAVAAPAPVSTGADAPIQPGDQIALRIDREPEMSGTFTVSETGEVVLPRLGAFRVAEASAGALQDSLVAAYGRYLRNPAIEVTVLRRIGVQGEVRRPDVYMVDLTVTLRDLIARAGGVTEAGSPQKIAVVREGETISLQGDESTNLLAAELRSGDQVVVGRRSWMARNPAAAVGTVTSLVSFVIGIVLLVSNNQ